MAKRLAIIGGGRTACDLAAAARKQNIVTIGFSLRDGAEDIGAFDRFYDIDILDRELLLEKCRQEKIDGVMPTTELTISPASYVAKQLGLNGNKPDLMDRITNKEWVRNETKNGKFIKHPSYFHLSDISNEYSRPFDFPVIVKPAHEGGKRGVCVAENEEKLKEALQYAFSMDRSHSGVLIEEYLSCGKECSVEMLSYHGVHQLIQITEKISSGAPFCVELGHSQPADISFEQRKKIDRAVRELLSILGFENGPTHTEIKLINEDVYLIELNARFGGDYIAYPLTQLSTGYDYLAEAIKVSFDEMPQKRSEIPGICYAGIRFVVEQTKELKDIFDNCEGKLWLFEKNEVSAELLPLKHNDVKNTNFFVYRSKEKPDFTL